MRLPPPSQSDFTPPPAGTHVAVCYRAIDLGTQLVDWQGQQKKQHKIMLSWELPNERMEDGRPFTISQRYTWSSSEKARLRQDLESWRGKKFTDSDFGPGGFDIRNIIGKGCLLNVVHNEKNGSTYANIAAVVQMPKGTTTPALSNGTVFFSLEEFNEETFKSLSEGLRAIIAKSPEYGEAVHRRERISDEPTGRHDPAFDDDIPF